MSESKRGRNSSGDDDDYESPHLGSDERNQKFLRLMGGGKKSGHRNVPHAQPAHAMPIEEYKPETTEDSRVLEETGKDKEEEIMPANIHSANKWENAELGDSSRKNKFLRLMGAARSAETANKDTPTQEIPQKAERKGYDKEQLEKDLEQQYVQGLEFRRSGGVRKHRGFGFVEEPPAPKEPEGGEGNPQGGGQESEGSSDTPRKRERRSRWDNDDYSRDRNDRDRDRSDQRHDRDEYQRDRDEYRRDRHDGGRQREDYGRESSDFRRDRGNRYDRSDHDRGGYRRDREGFQRDRHEYKSDPSEYGRVPRDNYKQQGFGGGYGNYPNNPGQNFQSQRYPGADYQHGGQQSQPQWSQQYQSSFKPAQNIANQGLDWSQPPPPPPPEPSQQSHPNQPTQQMHCSQQNFYPGAYGSEAGHGAPPGYGQPAKYQSYDGGAPPPQPQEHSKPAYGKYQKPMSFVKSSDS